MSSVQKSKFKAHQGAVWQHCIRVSDFPPIFKMEPTNEWNGFILLF